MFNNLKKRLYFLSINVGKLRPIYSVTRMDTLWRPIKTGRIESYKILPSGGEVGSTRLVIRNPHGLDIGGGMEKGVTSLLKITFTGGKRRRIFDRSSGPCLRSCRYFRRVDVVGHHWEERVLNNVGRVLLYCRREYRRTWRFIFLLRLLSSLEGFTVHMGSTDTGTGSPGRRYVPERKLQGTSVAR